jgi:hypothetical protein
MFNWLSPVGLTFDLAGVGLLSFDLIRIQRGLKVQANRRIEHVQGLIDEYGDVEHKLDEIANEMGWQHYNFEEGRPVPDYDSFDPDLLVRLASRAGSAFETVRSYLKGLSEFFIEVEDEEWTTARASLRYSYVGLLLIVLGFVLQLLGTLPPSVLDGIDQLVN